MQRNTSESPSALEAAIQQRLPTVKAEVDDAGLDNDHEHEDDEEDRDDVSVYEDEDEKAAVAEEKKLFDLVKREDEEDDDDDDDDDDCVEVHEEACGEEAVAKDEPVKTADTGDKKVKKRKIEKSQTGQKKKRVRKERVYDIRKFQHVELGRVISQEEQNKYPMEPERQADITAFREDWQHTVKVRYELAKGIKTWPLPRDCPFSPAAKDTLCRLGTQRAIAMSLRHLTLRQQEILGRGRRRAFDLADAVELPALDVTQQHEQVTYLNCVEDSIEGNGLYTGSATGKQGAAQRWTTYDKAKTLGRTSKSEANSAHQRAFLRENAIPHLRPLMVFPRSVGSTLVEIMEGFMMDFLETIDRSNLNEVCIKRDFLLHDATMLERSKEAFPPKRISTSCKGLNKVSSLKQATFGLLKNGCRAACQKCSSNRRAHVVYCDEESFQFCRVCKKAYLNARNYYTCIGTDFEILTAFVEVRKRSGRFSESECFQNPPKNLKCQYKDCNKLFAKKIHRERHEKICKKNPTPSLENPAPKTYVCQYKDCGKPFAKKGNCERHEKTCKKNPPPSLENPAPKTHVCQYKDCGKLFARKSHRVSHEKTCKKNPNPAPKTYVCQYKDCGKPFARKSNRENHEKTCPKRNHEKTCEKKAEGLERHS